ncbi:MAG TPA: chemotaxis protein CheW [Verrucomicrobiae bacterium]|jgi:purine-binding chemotaxis protein CheW|nr:chemotaxis protein CheW [Verrucomicrobiae bacterium]
MKTLVNLPAAAAPTAPAPGKYLTFVLGGESYGLTVLQVREIIRPMSVTPVPRLPRHILGVINLRGKVVPIFDLRLKFGLPLPATVERACVIVAQAKLASGLPAHIGLLVDTVEEVVALTAENIDDTPAFGFETPTQYIMGVARLGDEVKLLLNLDQVLHDESNDSAGASLL